MEGKYIVKCRNKKDFNEVQRICFSFGFLWRNINGICSGQEFQLCYGNEWIRLDCSKKLLEAYGNSDRYINGIYSVNFVGNYKFIEIERFVRKCKLEKINECRF